MSEISFGSDRECLLTDPNLEVSLVNLGDLGLSLDLIFSLGIPRKDSLVGAERILLHQ